MRIEQAIAADADRLVEMRDDRASWLLARGVRQWLPGEFPAERMLQWIRHGAVQVARVDGEVAAAVAVLWEDPDIWPDDGVHAGYVHLLMSSVEHAGRGLGSRMLAHAERRIRAAGRPVARLDAVASNEPLQRWYEGFGYDRVGLKAFDRPDVFGTVLLEKALSSPAPG